MEFFTNRYPKELMDSMFFQYGYHDATLDWMNRIEPLCASIKRGYSRYLSEDELNPKKMLFVIASNIVDAAVNYREHFNNTLNFICHSRETNRYQKIKVEQSDNLSRYVEVHESYTLMESKLHAIQAEKEQLEKRLEALLEQKANLEHLVSRLQNELDGVVN